jgi:FkbM family methyltransferase
VKVWGFHVQPPNMDRALAAWLLNAGLKGGDERRYFENSISLGEFVLDVGANQGLFTLLFSRLVGPTGRVLSIEPAPGMFTALDGNCRRNHTENVTRLHAAAGEIRSAGILHCSRVNSGDNRMTPSLRGRAVPVDIVSLDELVPSGIVDLVKIDVQGYEMRVVEGMRAMIARSPKIKVFFEYWPMGLSHAGSAPVDLLDLLVSHGFSLFEPLSAGLRKIEVDAVVRSTGAGYWSGRNLLAVRE